jgi:transglutaminase-like putative cysteine protease
VSRHLTELDFPTEWDKWLYLARAPEIDAKEPAIRELASHLLAACNGDRTRFVRLAMAFVRDVIQYETDTQRVGQEDIQRAGELSDMVTRGVDDCDALARLFVALCLAAGIPAEMAPKWKPNPTMAGGQELVHVFAFVQYHGEKRPVELTLYRARVGDLPDDVPKEVTGPHATHWLRNEAPQ